MTWREARHYSHTYGVSVVAGWCDHDEAVRAAEAANADDIDLRPAQVLRQRYLDQGGDSRRRPVGYSRRLYRSCTRPATTARRDWAR